MMNPISNRAIPRQRLWDIYSKRDLEGAIPRKLPREEPPIGLILCAKRNYEQFELLQLDQRRDQSDGVLGGAASHRDAGGQAARGRMARENASREKVSELKEMLA